MAWVLDLDGVLWLAGEPIAGSAAAVAALRAAGEQVAFVTNNSYATAVQVRDQLRQNAIDAETEEVVTSSMAVATLVAEGERVLVCGGPGIREALETAGAVCTESGPADAVVVGIDRAFDYARLEVASTLVRDGALFIASNTDATYPTPRGPVPGAGSIVAAVATASGVTPVVAGKPEQAMADLVRARVGTDGVAVGDRPDTDGAFARVLGYRFALVLSGVTRPSDLPVDPAPDLVADDLAAAVAALTGGDRPPSR